MNKEEYKFCCENCINRKIIENKYISMIVGIITKSYCLNAKITMFANHPKNKIEIYCKNYKKKDDD